MSFSPKKILKKTFAWFLRVLGILVLLLLIAWLLLQTQWGKNVVKDQAVKYLQNKLQTTVAIKGITIEWFSHIKLTGVYVEDREKRKLLSVGELDVKYDISDIFSNKLDIPEVSVTQLEVNLFRSRTDSNFNFSFIPAAFSTAGETESQDTTGSAFVLGLGKVSLNQLQFLMDDGYGGQYYKVALSTFNTEVDEFDLNKMQFHVKQVFSDSLNCGIKLTSPYLVKQEQQTSETTNFLFRADSIQLANNIFSFENPETDMLVQTTASLLGGSKLNYNQVNLHVNAHYITLREHTTKVQIKTAVKNAGTDSLVADSTLPFTYFVNHLDIIKSKVVFDDLAAPVLNGRQMDYSHLAFSNIDIHTDSTGFDGRKYFSTVKQLGAEEKSGFNLQQLSTQVQYADSFVSLKKIILKTPYNQIQGDAFISYPSIAAITTRPAATNVNLYIKNSSLQLDELLFFNPALAANVSFKPLLGKKFLLNTVVNGTLEKLSIPSLLMQQANTKLLASALVYHPMDVNKLAIDLTLKEFSGNKKELLAFLPPNTIPDSFLSYIPETFSIAGSYKGKPDDFFADLQLKSPDGFVSITGTSKDITDKDKAVYDLDIITDNLKLGKLMQDSTFGNITVSAKLKGKGYDIKTMNAAYDIKLKQARYNNYTYNGVSLTGIIAKQKVSAKLNSTDPNLQLTSDTYYDLSNTDGSFKTNTSIDNINLTKLGFSKDTIIIKGSINADFPEFDTTAMTGFAHITGVNIQYQKKKYQLDTLKINATHAADTQSLSLTTPFADAVLKGEYTFSNIGPAVTSVINKYLYKETADIFFDPHVVARLNMNVHIPDSLAGIMGMTSIKPFIATGAINTDSAELAFAAVIPGMKYGTYIIDTVTIAANSDDTKHESLSYVFKVNRITAPSFILPESVTGGEISKGIIDGRIALLDDDRETRYLLPYTITNDTLLPYLHIHDSLLINKRKWAVNDSNIIYLSAEKLKGSQLTISNGEESFGIIAEGTEESGLPLTVRFDRFKLRNISEIVVADSALIKGETNGTFTITSLSDFTFTSNLLVDSLVIKEVPAGDLAIKVNQQTEDKLSVDISLQGNGNDVTLKGTYNLAESKPALFLEMSPFNLEVAEPLASSYLASLKGNILGSLNINGTLDKPAIIGALLLDSIKAVYRDYNTFISIPSSGLSFEDGAINFSPLYFTDSAGNKGVITGNVFTSDYRDYRFDLKMKATNFTVVGIKKYPDQAAYGPTSADALITISGNMKTIMLDGSVNVVGKSKFTYIYRPDEMAPEGEGLMEFFDPAHPDDTTAIQKKIEAAAAAMQMAMNIYLRVQPEATVTIMLDEMTGDNLTISGTANLNTTMSAGGQMYLTGSYVVDKGTYDLSIASLIRKKFSIEKGSTITWTGDPLKADMDITAMYKIKTTAGELVTDQQSVAGIDKQQMNFEVYLLLTGELLKPTIGFRIDMDEADQQLFNGIVYTRIKQVNSIEAELNKQVMGLLAINNFIADNPFSSLSGGGPSFQTQAYATAGRLLTQELTELLGQAIKGVDIDFGLDVNENYTSGSAQRNTNLKVGISKSVANNRLHIYVGSSFALEGQNQNVDALSGLAGDVTLEYLLTKNGKYRIKAYRINQTELTFQAAIVKTGVSFVVVLEFNKIKSVFKKRKNNNNRANTK